MLTRRLLRVATAWTLITLAWCAFVIALATQLKAQTPGCYQIEGTGELCLPGTGEIFVDVAGGSPTPLFTHHTQPWGLLANHLRPDGVSAFHAAATPRIIPAHQKLASDAWIDRSNNKKGERCCDSGKDCWSLAPERVKPTEGGVNVTLDDGETMFVPGREIMPSEDGKYWLCVWGGKRRCFFAPYSGS